MNTPHQVYSVLVFDLVFVFQQVVIIYINLYSIKLTFAMMRCINGTELVFYSHCVSIEFLQFKGQTLCRTIRNQQMNGTLITGTQTRCFAFPVRRQILGAYLIISMWFCLWLALASDNWQSVYSPLWTKELTMSLYDWNNCRFLFNYCNAD